MGELIEFPFWRRQDEIAVSSVLERGGDIHAFLIRDDLGHVAIAATRAHAVREAYYLQQRGGRAVSILFRPDEASSYDVVAEVPEEIAFEDLPMEEDLDE